MHRFESLQRQQHMRERKAARLLVINPAEQILLFRFHYTNDALAGTRHWATPGGGVEEGETFQAAAIRELREETGMRIATVGEPLDERRFPLLMPDGETVLAIERYFLVPVEDTVLSQDEWTEHEREVMTDHHWWSAAELQATEETVWPKDLLDMLTRAGAFKAPA